ncbi:hypothetical protein [Amaricoccus sp. W119]|uniref:hypothetical protein n=1 Tax=Amaricoccus sp. W119 TaxID=3391833 RepID=UPI0039A75E0C
MTAASLLGLGAILGFGALYTQSIAGDEWSQSTALAATLGCAIGWAAHWMLGAVI